VNVAVRDDGGADVATAVGVAGATLVPEDGERAVDAVVAVGEAALRSAAADPPDAPLLPVTAGGGRHLVARDSLDAALAAAVAGDTRVASHAVLGVRRDDAVVGRALRDVTVVTASPGSISEYAVTAGGRSVVSVRADGVVVATPVGSDGYAAAAGGPVLDAGTGVAVVPIAPFSTAATTHVTDPGAGLAVSVERRGEVAVYLDGVRRGAVDVDADLRIDRDGTLDVLVPTGTEKF
jgi:NAD+ kinase